jgi:hypothetical protein
MKEKLKKVFKSPLIILVLVVFGGGVVFTRFYDVVIVRKPILSPAQITQTRESKAVFQSRPTEKTKLPDFKDIDLNVDLNNLSASDRQAVWVYLKFRKIKTQVIPSGVPEIYGKELGISFDRVQEAINKVAPFGPTYGKKKINLTENEKARYIKIGSQTACKYCCGATTLVFENGRASCGCAHSQMMRGLAAYLIKNHPEMSDEEILNELNKWRATFFPRQTLAERLQALEQSGEQGIKELLQEFPEFLPQMVGGC